MNYFRSQSGAGHLVAVLLIVVIAVVGFAGYTVMKSQDKKQTVTTSQQKVDAVPDLQQADTTLNDTDKELQTNLDTSALDEDIDAML
ncbi:hypothetical protein IPL85_05605 [Candidatus Saccharibacteria bacterium]|nr:MAG: hypothetical protein IPL85_05605 [Candidatus Saccharibacteria bacterium]